MTEVLIDIRVQAVTVQLTISEGRIAIAAPQTQERSANGAVRESVSSSPASSPQALPPRSRSLRSAALQRAAVKPAWSKEEIQQLRDLWPDHSASVIARRMGRCVNGVRSKAIRLNLKKAGPPAVTARPSSQAARSAPTPGR